MKLKDLLQDVPVKKMCADPEMEIKYVAHDSRKVRPGGMFIAITGYATDGNLYVAKAVENGMGVLVTAVEPTLDVPYVLVESDRLAMALIGRNYYHNPAASMKLIGVTGTNGKTSSTLLLKYVLEEALGAKVGLMGTMENMIGAQSIPTERTTPESFELQELLARMRDGGCTYAIMEVSSHAIALDRVAGLTYDVAAFTNLTEDHLDFHKTMEAYCDTKAELFARCNKAVVNRDDPWCDRILRKCTCPVLGMSVHGTGDLMAKDEKLLPDGIRFTAVYGDQQVPVKLSIPGRFTVYNAMTVLAMALELGISLSDAAKALETAKGVKGRIEVVPTPGMPFTVLIDYAHTPDGLENVLSSVRDFCKGRLIAVFGCGGDRDSMKRPIMGKIGTDIADIAVITSDNPRTEIPGEIIRDIVKGVDSRKNNYEIIENRSEAICHAMDIAQKNDIIVLAGKGHETYQEINGVKHHMDEREIVAAHLKEMR